MRFRLRRLHPARWGHSVRYLQSLGSGLLGRCDIAQFAATPRLLPGLLLCRYSWAVTLSLSLRASRKAVEAVSIRCLGVSRDFVSLAVQTVASRIMSRIRGLAATGVPRAISAATIS